MTTLEERYEGNFLEASDLPEGALVSVEIEAITPPDAERDAAKRIIKRAILQFKGKKKRLILNKTGFRVLKILFGAATDDWVGKTVQLQRRYLPAHRTIDKHENEPCVRIVPPEGTPIPKSVRDFLGSKLPIS